MRRGVFLDRDGTLIREVGYLRRTEDLEVLTGVPEALRRLGDAGFVRLVVTNQSGVARGYVAREFVDRTHEVLQGLLRAEEAGVEGFYVCAHHPDHTGPCSCRKPQAGLLLRAAEEWGLDLRKSWVVGDKAEDVELAHRAGCRAVLVRTGYGRQAETRLRTMGLAADAVAEDMAGAVDVILSP